MNSHKCSMIELGEILCHVDFRKSASIVEILSEGERERVRDVFVTSSPYTCLGHPALSVTVRRRFRSYIPYLTSPRNAETDSDKRFEDLACVCFVSRPNDPNESLGA